MNDEEYRQWLISIRPAKQEMPPLRPPPEGPEEHARRQEAYLRAGGTLREWYGDHAPMWSCRSGLDDLELAAFASAEVMRCRGPRRWAR